MECACGGSTQDAKAERSKTATVLHYTSCKACGRNEYLALIVAGITVARGVEAQRAFLAMEDGAPAPTAPPSAPAPQEQAADEPWRPASPAPHGDGLIEVRFAAGGSYIARPAYFAQSWDLVAGWRPYDNGPALEAARHPTPTPPELRVGSPTAPQRTRPPAPPPPVEVPRGETYSLF